MITPDGWFSWAIRQPGPLAKSGYPGAKESDPEGVVFHSAEGSAAVLLALVDDLDREASWTASNLKDGRFIQHYPIRVVVWTNGSRLANIKFRGIESEGVAGEPLTLPQIANLTQCAGDMRDFFGWPGFRRGLEGREHNEMTAFGAAATACPSGRIPWNEIVATLQEDDMGITQEQLDEALKARDEYLGKLSKENEVLRTDLANLTIFAQAVEAKLNTHIVAPHAGGLMRGDTVKLS